MGPALPRAHDDDQLGNLFDYVHPKDVIAKGSGQHRLYVMMLVQEDRFDNEVADRGITTLRLRMDGIFGDNEDPNSYSHFSITKFKDTYNMEAIYIAECLYNS